MHSFLTAIHGRLLSRESLIHFHDQGREGAARVEKTFHEIETTFLRGCDRNNAPLIFFIPSDEVWDAGYFDKLSQLRFSPGANKTFTMTLARQIDNEVRAFAIQGIGGGPGADLDITMSPEISVVRIGNRSETRSVQECLFSASFKNEYDH